MFRNGKLREQFEIREMVSEEILGASPQEEREQNQPKRGRDLSLSRQSTGEEVRGPFFAREFFGKRGKWEGGGKNTCNSQRVSTRRSK